jgi:signal peptidase I
MSTAVAEQSAPQTEEPYRRGRLVGGLIGRAWLWFVAGCLLVTLLPMLIGWRPYVVETGSMTPRIKPGDVVVASPNHDTAALLGHVIVFDSPSQPGKIVTHRAIRTDGSGRIVTKGDANPSPDGQPVEIQAVHGLGRLLVRTVGLPLLWIHRGQWLPLGLFLASLWLAAVLVHRDEEEDEDDEGEDDEAGGRRPPRAVPAPSRAADAPVSSQVAASRPPRLPRSVAPVGLLRRAGSPRFAVRMLLVGIGGLALLAPSTVAAFAATTSTVASTWSVPVYSYPVEATALGPYVYYRMDDANGSNTLVDSSRNGYTGTYSPTNNNRFSWRLTGALPDQTPNYAVSVNQADSCIYTPATSGLAAPGPSTYSIIAWIRTSPGYSGGGKIAGLESQRTGVSDSNNGGQYDRHLYMDGSGFVRFGVWTGAPTVLTTPGPLNDGSWHMVVATMGPAGSFLYVDGAAVASSANTQSEAERATGYWRFGCGNLSGWQSAWSGPNAPSAQQNYAFLGSLDELAVYLTQLTPADVSFLYFTR